MKNAENIEFAACFLGSSKQTIFEINGRKPTNGEFSVSYLNRKANDIDL
jgi:hypothetical protein